MPVPVVIDPATNEFADALVLLVRRVRSEASPTELSLGERSVLSRLRKDGVATIAELARGEGMKPQSMGAIVATLEQNQLVKRTPHPSDKRQWLIGATAKGAQAQKRIQEEKRSWLSQAIAQLKPEEQKVLAKAAVVIQRLAEL